MSSNSKKTSGGKDEKKNPSSKEESPVSKDEAGGSASTGSIGGGTSADGTQPGSKPGSAGATSREAAQKLLGLAARGEWAPVDQLLKSLEKAVQSVGEDGPLLPLASIMDPATGMTPLMYAVKDNRTGLLDRMIELGADVGARNSASIPRNSKYFKKFDSSPWRGLTSKIQLVDLQNFLVAFETAPHITDGDKCFRVKI